MPSSKGTSNSNKTAHVMNLLRKNNPAPKAGTAESPAPAAPAAPPAPAAPAAPAAASPASAAPAAPAAASPAPAPAAPQTPPIIASMHADAEISAQIRDALEEELARDTENNAAAIPLEIPSDAPEDEAPVLPAEDSPSEAPASYIQKEQSPSQPAPSPDTLSSKAPEAPASEKASPQIHSAAPKKPVPAEAPAGQPQVKVQPEPAPSSSKEPVCPSAMVNIMQKLTEEKADKYLRLFDVCSCPLCKMDVIALALNHLTPKYVVMEPAELLIRSDMYDRRYNGEIAAQLMRACKKVKDHPRHE